MMDWRRKNGRRVGKALVLCLAAAVWAGGAWAEEGGAEGGTGGMSLEEADRLISMGRKAREDGLHEFAAKRLWEAAAAPDRHRRAVAYLELARVELARGNAREALNDLGMGEDEAGGELVAEYVLERGEALAALGAAEDALAALEELPAALTDAQAARAARLRTAQYLAAGRLDDAVKACGKAEALLGATEETGGDWMEVAQALGAAGRREESEKVLARLWAEDAEWPAGVKARAYVANVAGDARWALEKGDGSIAAEGIAALADWCGKAGEEVARETRHWAWRQLAELQAVAGMLEGDEAPASAARAEELSGGAAERRSDRLLGARVALKRGDLEEGTETMRAVAAELREAGEADGAGRVQGELAAALSAAGEWEGAEREWKTWLEAFADGGERTRDAQRARAEALGKLGRAEEAAEAWREVLRLTPEAPAELAVFEAAGDALRAARDPAGAEGAYRTALALSAGDAEETARLEFLLAETALERGDAAAGEVRLRELSRSAEAGDLAWRASMRLGALYEARRADEAALGEYGRVAAGAPSAAMRAEALLARGLVLYHMGSFLPALEDFRKIGADHPGTAPAARAMFMGGWCLYLLGKDDEALAACRGFLKEHADSEFAPDVRFWLGEYAFNRGDWEGAEKAFRELADLHPASAAAPEALYWAGRSAAAAREYLRANEHFNALLAGWPDDPLMARTLLAQGDVLGELGQFPAAILAFDEVITKFPHGEAAMAAWGRKGDCLYTLGQDDPSRYEEALLCYRALHDFADAPEDLHLQAGYKIGRCLEKTGHAEEAVEQYVQTAYDYLGRTSPTGESGVWFTRSAFGAAALLERAGRRDEAAGIYRRVAESGAPAAVEARERLKRLEGERSGLAE